MGVKRDCMWVGCAVLLSLGAGCGADQPTENDYDSVAQALGSVAATSDGGGEVGAMFDASAIATGAPGAGISLNASGSFSGNHLGLKYDYHVACADAAGKVLDRCSSASDSADVSVEWSGMLNTAALSGMVSREGMFKLSGIQSGTVTIAGSSSLSADAHFQAILSDATRDYRLSYKASYDGVQIQHSPAKLIGGSIHYALEVERKATNGATESSKNFEIDADLVFDANGGAKLTLDGEHHYTINTSSGAVTDMDDPSQI
jgi:hypothetical protein